MGSHQAAHNQRLLLQLHCFGKIVAASNFRGVPHTRGRDLAALAAPRPYANMLEVLKLRPFPLEATCSGHPFKEPMRSKAV